MACAQAEGGEGVRVDPAALFARLGLKPADERPIMEGWREANSAWRREHLRRIAAHAERIKAHLKRFGHVPVVVIKPPARKRMGQPRPVWCVELRRYFRTMSAAAEFVQRKPSNISQALRLGVRCGRYHWVEPGKDGMFPKGGA